MIFFNNILKNKLKLKNKKFLQIKDKKKFLMIT